MTDRHHPLPDAALDQLFREARTRYAWADRPVSDATIQALYDLMKWGPTSANAQPGRYLFLRTKEAKARLAPFVMEQNLDKVMAAPVVALVGYDMRFHDQLPAQFPHADAKSWFEGNDALIEETAMRNGSLQGAYLMLAARALGLDVGPMSGFDRQGATAEFCAKAPGLETVHINFLCNLGYGTDENLYPRGPRLSFDEAARLL
ncbi:malonic semialdehyde reductase [Parvularcula dongshanensis]|uniref:Putative NADH dehydrogenase/NAD(P)H nitroreductase GGQ59_000611 n=1 Tax=Parvularcula dongshanensis TaxID=1173995 RepID=A0A840I1F1_9PROT|nr:malonic semialdehyde reductase [Parvularcula dongshanensis]MBB4658111.1 3-hydroxypropanoate dehydrogenase [Parvularcula dongshanensis]